jgi:hypothetical protein
MPNDRPLNPAGHIKPLDFGADGVTGSINADGRLIALNTYHPRYGYVTLTTADPFPEDQRYNPAAVRAYRAGLAALHGFGPDLESAVWRRDALLTGGAVPAISVTLENGTHMEMVAWAYGGGAFQEWETGTAPRWRGRLSLQRCAYTQLTEGGPVPMPPTETHARFKDGVLTIENPALEWAAAISGFPPGETWERRALGPIEIDIAGAGESTTLVYGFGPTAAAALDAVRRLAQNPFDDLDSELDRWREYLDGLPSPHLAVQRGISYGLMLAVPVGATCCILTDHMLLPLSWNRDAYYVARALLDRQPDIVRRHLLWMFETAERRDGVWGRCYLANGQIKDAAFQLDQQLFPLLELAEYVGATSDRATWDRLRPAIAPVIDRLLARKATHTWLFPTDETPADDPVALPYHFSSHVVMWFTLRQIAALLGDDALADSAEAIRRAVLEHFTATRDGQSLYAYATDGAGNHHFYHDANDFPLVLAPVWGFTPVDDPVWRATLDFAFSEANQGGYYDGRLGSVHTRAPWPLGDVQDLLIARLLHDPARESRAWEHINRAAQWDGALPEAYDATTGEVVSRHWFAWPNAALACVALGAFGG